VKLSAGEWSQTQTLTVKLDPRLAKDGVSQADLIEQLNLNLQLREVMADARRLVQQIDDALIQPGGTESSVARLRELRKQLVTAPVPYPQPMLIDQLQSLARMANGADRKVGRSAVRHLQVLKKQLAEIQAALPQ
jgi:hypothetical protein